MTLFSFPARAATPSWVENLTRHDTIQEVEPTKREEVACVALAIYFEARGESAKGQLAVGNVVINRTRSGKYPTTACGVLFQKGQFSFIRKRPVVPKEDHLWEAAIATARAVLLGQAEDASHGATSFCQRRLRKTGYSIGNHVFY